jgi:hypothetical protein
MEGFLAITALVVVAALAGCLVWALHWGQSKSDTAYQSAVSALASDRRTDAAIAERDAALANAGKWGVELGKERTAHVATQARLAAAEEVITHELQRQISVASPDDLAGVAARLLADREALMSSRAAALATASGDRRPPGLPDVQAPRPAAEARRADGPDDA